MDAAFTQNELWQEELLTKQVQKYTQSKSLGYLETSQLAGRAQLHLTNLLV